jgi:hypothetical protein
LLLGVGGKVVEATKVELVEGQVGYRVEPAVVSDGVAGGVTSPYAVTRAVKSALGVAVEPDTVTIPKVPPALEAGKYENANPPEKTSDI